MEICDGKKWLEALKRAKNRAFVCCFNLTFVIDVIFVFSQFLDISNSYLARITRELLGITLYYNKCYRYYDLQTVSFSHYNFIRELCVGYLRRLRSLVIVRENSTVLTSEGRF